MIGGGPLSLTSNFSPCKSINFIFAYNKSISVLHANIFRIRVIHPDFVDFVLLCC
jgi:hypothetical protein